MTEQVRPGRLAHPRYSPKSHYSAILSSPSVSECMHSRPEWRAKGKEAIVITRLHKAIWHLLPSALRARYSGGNDTRRIRRAFLVLDNRPFYDCSPAKDRRTSRTVGMRTIVNRFCTVLMSASIFSEVKHGRVNTSADRIRRSSR